MTATDRGTAESALATAATVAAGATDLAPRAGAAGAATLDAVEAARLADTRPTLVARATTVLPRGGAAARAPAGEQPRYLANQILGEGGMGEVVLARDHDIERRVAIKRLRAEAAGEAGLLRFAEEVRTAGSLEHPGIVPVYDVGVDADGHHYFVMKYLEGETLESVIAKLRAGNASYVRKYTFEHRTQVFLKILHAVSYAHAQGILHRDIKPANVMVGPHGEVTLTDWGIAKRIRPEGAPPARRTTPETAMERARSPLPMKGRAIAAEVLRGIVGISRPPPAGARDVAAELSATRRDAGSAGEGRVLATVAGALLGTPLYMSPEQARGDNGALDERSDVFSLCVLLHELITLTHYLEDRSTVNAVIDAILRDDQDETLARIQGGFSAAGAPHELGHVALRGMTRDPERRWQSVDEMIEVLDRALHGEVCVHCPFTLAKACAMGATRTIESHPRIYGALAILVPALAVIGLVALVVVLVRAAG